VLGAGLNVQLIIVRKKLNLASRLMKLVSPSSGIKGVEVGHLDGARASFIHKSYRRLGRQVTVLNLSVNVPF
jgi:hypothetical protein